MAIATKNATSAKNATKSKFSKATYLGWYENMYRIRKFEEATLKAYSLQKIYINDLQFGLSLRYAPCTISISVMDRPKIQRYSSTTVPGTSFCKGIHPMRSLEQ